MTLTEIKLNYFVESEFFCPFDREAYDLLANDVDSQIMLEDFISLFAKVNFEFSSPGNSVPRNVIYELNRPYLVEKYRGNAQLFPICKNNQMLLSEYNELFGRLLSKATILKFRILQPDKLLHLSSSEFSNGIKINSEYLTQEGIQVALNTFKNIPLSILEKFSNHD